MDKIAFKTKIVALFIIIFATSLYTFAGPGDTITVQTFTFGSTQNAKFKFPDYTHRYSKILMYYTLKCNPAQNPACGEWDYITYNYLYEHTGKKDSTLLNHTNFIVNNTTPDSLICMKNPSWAYFSRKEYYNQTTPTNVVFIGNGTVNCPYPFSSQGPDAKTYLLWKSSELAAAGLVAGNITGLRFAFVDSMQQINNLKIRMKNVVLPYLNESNIPKYGFTEVYSRNISGYKNVPFTYPFYWDSISDILIEISFPGYNNISSTNVLADTTSYTSVLNSSDKDFVLNFKGSDNVEIPVNQISTLDSAITVACWFYGDPLKQPSQDDLFEGINAAGNRVINAHTPWNDGVIYWDAGNVGGTYDRMSKASDSAAEYKGKWNHWAFTKDVKSGTMKIYLNGKLWSTATGKTRLMKNIAKFKIGSTGNGNGGFYHGMIDEFSVWNKALDSNSIKALMYHNLNLSHPDYSNLIAYYKFNEGSGTVTSESKFGARAKLYGIPDWRTYQGVGRFKNFNTSSIRPQMIFEQGSYNTANMKSTIVVDSVMKPLMMIIMFRDKKKPASATDTIYRWPYYFHSYKYDVTGKATDSVFVNPDSLLRKEITNYYGAPFEVVNTYEMGRFITPYGINLDLGSGFTWVYDVTDYAPLLYDSVHLAAGNWQEFMDMKFVMIEGTPARDVLGITTLYQGSTAYNANAENGFLKAKKAYIPGDVKMARLKFRVTGNGMGGNDNCAEFCDKTHNIKLNGVKRFDHRVWRDNCDVNPLYPQGGTWIYHRANWCPGAEVYTSDFEITPFITPSDTLTVDYDFQPYTWNGQGSQPNYVIVGQLITYGDAHFTNDAAIEEIIKPNDQQLYLRENPICNNPRIIIKNNGKDDLTSVWITYGAVGGNQASYQWKGTLKFQEKTTIDLPEFYWGHWGTENLFRVTLSSPNAVLDEYELNNSMTSKFTIPPVYPTKLVLFFKTNNAASESSYTLEDTKGNVLYSRSNMANSTLYKDTFNFGEEYGCYKLTIRDSDGDGLSFWANNDGSGYARIKQAGNPVFLLSFNEDFGAEISQSFTVFYSLDVKEEPSTLNFPLLEIYPNPAKDYINVELEQVQTTDLKITMCDMYGRIIFDKQYSQFKDGIVKIEIGNRPEGLYFLNIIKGSSVVTKKIIIAK